jgi:hypothetical protein
VSVTPPLRVEQTVQVRVEVVAVDVIVLAQTAFPFEAERLEDLSGRVVGLEHPSGHLPQAALRERIPDGEFGGWVP